MSVLQPSCHYYERPWLVRDVTMGFSMVTRSWSRQVMVTPYLGLRIMPQNGLEFGPGFHGYNRDWFVRDVTTRVATLTMEGVAILMAVRATVKVKVPPSCHEDNIREAEVQDWMDRSGRLTSLPL